MYDPRGKVTLIAVVGKQRFACSRKETRVNSDSY